MHDRVSSEPCGLRTKELGGSVLEYTLCFI